MAVDVVVGLQRGDEGKGRFVDLLAEHYDIVARFNGGPNAGHTIGIEGNTPLKLHQVPSGITYSKKLNVIGNGALLDPVKLVVEIASIEAAGFKISPANLAISDCAHLILPHDISRDEIREAGEHGQDTTKSGIAYVAREKYERCGVRAELIISDPDKLYETVYAGLVTVNKERTAVGLPRLNAKAEAESWLQSAKKLQPFITDTVRLVHEKLQANASLLAEGAQASWLDIDHGMYPYVTSSHTTTGGASIGLGIGPTHFGKVFGVLKVVKSHVGGGPFVTKITDQKLATTMRGEPGKIDSEYGATTGRERQVGYLDLPELRRAILISGVTELAITKLDTAARFGATIPVAIAYKLGGKNLSMAPSSALQLEHCLPIYQELPGWTEDISTIRTFADLPPAAQTFVTFISAQLGVPITMIGVGPHREQVILRSRTTS